MWEYSHEKKKKKRIKKLRFGALGKGNDELKHVEKKFFREWR